MKPPLFCIPVHLVTGFPLFLTAFSASLYRIRSAFSILLWESFHLLAIHHNRVLQRCCFETLRVRRRRYSDRQLS